MARPIILAVDDDASVLEAVVQDLRRKYGQNYRILRAGSGQAALDTCAQLKERGDTVALIVSGPADAGDDRRGAAGEGAGELPPGAQSAADGVCGYGGRRSGPSNTAADHYYLTKPWDPPGPGCIRCSTICWKTGTRDTRRRSRGSAWWGRGMGCGITGCGISLSRNQVPYVLAGSRAGRSVPWNCMKKGFGVDDSKLPVVMFFRTNVAGAAGAMRSLAQRVGLRTQADARTSTIWVGGGRGHGGAGGRGLWRFRGIGRPWSGA